jgi:hypothetical protein
MADIVKLVPPDDDEIWLSDDDGDFYAVGGSNLDCWLDLVLGDELWRRDLHVLYVTDRAALARHFAGMLLAEADRIDSPEYNGLGARRKTSRRLKRPKAI